MPFREFFMNNVIFKAVVVLSCISFYQLANAAPSQRFSAECASANGKTICASSDSASSITRTSAVLTGTVIGGGASTQSWIEVNGPGLNCPMVDPSTSANSSKTCKPWALGSGQKSASFKADFLKCGEKYNFRLVARDGDAFVGDSKYLAFKTLACE